MDNKPVMLVFAPVATRSGYGDMSRDLVRHFIEYDKFEVKILSVPWGNTPFTALDEDNPRDRVILERILTEPYEATPEVYVHVGLPSEAAPRGKFNILCTAGVETTAVSAEWVAMCNRMDLVLTISKQSKAVFEGSRYKVTRNGAEEMLQVDTPIEVLHNCVNTKVFGRKSPVDYDFAKEIDAAIKENFCFLFVGHWLKGEYGEDRKNVPLMVKLFLETFKQLDASPALILKTSTAGFGILDREGILARLRALRESVELSPGQTLPKVYLLHGDLTEKQMNTLYNHEKVKVHVSFTKGEGFGRPLLEASLSGKPVIASGWGGHMDFLDTERALLVGGELKPVHESAQWDKILIKEAQWFAPDQGMAMNGMAAAAINYSDYKKPAYELATENRKKFSYEAIRDRTFELLDQYIPEFPKRISITLPAMEGGE